MFGTLYRNCLGAQDMDSSKEVDEILYAVPDDGDFDEDAENFLAEWNNVVMRLTDAFRVEIEGNLVSGQVASFGAHPVQLRGRREHVPLLMPLNRRARDLRSEVGELYWDDVGSPVKKLRPRGVQPHCRKTGTGF